MFLTKLLDNTESLVNIHGNTWTGIIHHRENISHQILLLFLCKYLDQS